MQELSRKSGRKASRAVSSAVTRRLTELARDRRSGAAEIARRARAALARALREGASPARLAEAGATLIRAQPAMAPLYRVVNDACLGTLHPDSGGGPLSLRPLLLRRPTRVLTYSRSSTVLQALLAARGRLAAVLCSEGRPGGEGLRLARELARARLPVQLLTDAALFGRLEEVDLVVVGADALLSQAVVNKVGTCPLAILARQAGRPFFVVAERDKILPAGLERFFRLPARSLFDRTPYRLVSGIVCEFGVLGRTELAREMRRAQVSPALVRALRRSSV